MKLIEQERAIQLTDNLVAGTRRFRIEMSAKMAKILSDGIYSDKVLAVVRELSTNAYDSHVDNGNPEQPFEVHLPFYGDNEFWIRDFGTGMSPEKIDTLYTGYGLSDKDGSNEFVGALGLGSKSFFCYHTRSATVISWYNGMKYTYQCFLDSESIPSITLLSKVKSDEPSGVKVMFKTSSNDERSFQAAAQKVYQYFSVVPKFVGGRSITIFPVEYSLRSTVWGVRDKNHGEGARAIMGQLAYDIDFPESVSLNSDENNILNAPVDLMFELGDLDIETSREGLSFDKRTQLHIRQRLHAVSSEIKELLEKKIAESKNLWEARLHYCTIVNDMRGVGHFADYTKLTYGGKALFNSHMSVSLYDLASDAPFLTYYLDRGYYNRSKGRVREGKSTSISVKKEAVFIENDLERGAKSRCQEYLANNPDAKLYLFTFKSPEARRKAMEAIGIDDSYLIKASSLPKKVNGPRAARSGKTDVVRFKQGVDNNVFKTVYWENCSIDPSTTSGYYVETRIYDFVLDGNAHDPTVLRDIVHALKALNVTVPADIYGVKTAEVKKFKNNKNWQNFLDWAIDKMVDKAYTQSVPQLESDAKEFKACFQSNYGTGKNRLDYTEMKVIAKRMPNDHAIARFFAKAEIAGKSESKLDAYRKIATLLAILKKTHLVKTTVVPIGLKDMEDAIYRKYPLFHCFSFTYNGIRGTEADSIAEYVNLIDSQRGNQNGK